ncbi:MAG: hypothetical protein J6Q65_03385, partial [Lentisphaeria bacterium]|nr:hypothetical protein [Lentisphaeria bacterium]
MDVVVSVRHFDLNDEIKQYAADTVNAAFGEFRLKISNVNLVLDMQKNLRELATLTMIGATWIQIFRMQLLKYGAIFLAVFPFGIAGAAGLMSLVCALTKNISADRVFLWFRFDMGAMVILLLLSAAILCGVVFVISKRMTSVAHSQMLSAVH